MGACSMAQVDRMHRRRPRRASRDMYRIDRADLEWILDADDPSESFPTLAFIVSTLTLFGGVALQTAPAVYASVIQLPEGY